MHNSDSHPYAPSILCRRRDRYLPFWRNPPAHNNYPFRKSHGTVAEHRGRKAADPPGECPQMNPFTGGPAFSGTDCAVTPVALLAASLESRRSTRVLRGSSCHRS